MTLIFNFLLIIFFLNPTGKVVYVSDGDTFHIMINDEKVKVRVEGIDCPEKTQDFGLEAKEFAMKEILNKTVQIEVIDIDRYGRKVARVYYDGKDLSKELLRNGYAWHFKKYNKDEELNNLEADARKLRKGLWSVTNPIPPWEYRKSNNMN